MDKRGVNYSVIIGLIVVALIILLLTLWQVVIHMGEEPIINNPANNSLNNSMSNPEDNNNNYSAVNYSAGENLSNGTFPYIPVDNETEENASCQFSCNGVCVPPEIPIIIKTIWENRKQYIIDNLEANLEEADTITLYNTQTWTNNLLTYASYCKDYEILDGLSEVYLTTYDYLELQTTYKYKYVPQQPTWSILNLSTPSKMWIASDGTEVILDNSQFLYLIGSTINSILEIDKASRTKKMNELVEKFTPILTEHYERWVYDDGKIFSVKGWGCEKTGSANYNHYDFLNKKYHLEFGNKVNYSYCNMITDADMWIIAGVTELLSANSKNPILIPISIYQRQKFLEYVELGSNLIASRLTVGNLINFDGNMVKGANFDLGAWGEHPTHEYSGYTGEAFPTAANKATAVNEGWDIGHARRFVQVFETLYDNKAITGQSFPTKNNMTALTNQLIYGVFNKNFTNPLFTNYMDGTNGWYKVDLAQGTGYPPYGRSLSYMYGGGYSFWCKYNSDVRRVDMAMWNMVNIALNGSNQGIRTFASQNYATDGYSNFQRDTSFATFSAEFNKNDSIELLTFLPSIAVEERCE